MSGSDSLASSAPLLSLSVGLPAAGGGSPHSPAQELPGPPKSLMLLSTHPALFVDPGRPSEDSPFRPLCVGFPSVNTVAVCSFRSNGAVSSFRKCGLPYRLRGSLCTLQRCRSASLPSPEVSGGLARSPSRTHGYRAVCPLNPLSCPPPSSPPPSSLQHSVRVGG